MPLHATVTDKSEITKMLRETDDLGVDTFERLVIARNSETVLPYLGTPLSDNTLDPFTGLPIGELLEKESTEVPMDDIADACESATQYSLLYTLYSEFLGHWLRDPIITGLMNKFTFFLSCKVSVHLGQYIKSSLKVVTVDEARKEGLTWEQSEIPCSFSRTGRSSGTAYKVIHLSNLDISQPENRGMGMVVKHTGPVKISHPEHKGTKIHLSGNELMGEVVHFLKREKKDRSAPDSPGVACIKLTRAINGLPIGTNARIPIESVCKVSSLN